MFFQKLLLLRIRIDDCSLVRLSNVLDAILRILRDDYSLVRKYKPKTKARECYYCLFLQYDKTRNLVYLGRREIE